MAVIYISPNWSIIHLKSGNATVYNAAFSYSSPFSHHHSPTKCHVRQLSHFDTPYSSITTPSFLLFLTAPPLFLSLRSYANPARIFKGLRAYYVPVPGSSGANPKAKKVTPKSSTTLGTASSSDIDLDGAENLYVSPMSSQDWKLSLYYDQIDFLSFLFLLTLSTSIISSLLTHLQLLGGDGGQPTNLPLILALLTLASAAHTLLKTDLLSANTAGEDKVYGAAFGILCFLAALGILDQLAPKGYFIWDVEHATTLVGPMMENAARPLLQAHRNRVSSPSPSSLIVEGGEESIEEAVAEAAAHVAAQAAAFMHFVSPAAWVLRLLIAAISGCLGALLFSPSLRFVRGFWLHQNIPEWAADQLGTSVFYSIMLHAQMFLFPLNTAVGIKTLSTLYIGSNSNDELMRQKLAWIQACAALITGLVALANTRVLIQKYLDTGMLAWHHVKHGKQMISKKERGGAAGLIRIKFAIMDRLKGRAALQSLAPGLLMTVCGVALLSIAYQSSSLVVGGMGGGEGGELVKEVVGFLSWWISGVVSFLYVVDVFLFRTGVLQN